MKSMTLSLADCHEEYDTKFIMENSLENFGKFLARLFEKSENLLKNLGNVESFREILIL